MSVLRAIAGAAKAIITGAATYVATQGIAPGADWRESLAYALAAGFLTWLVPNAKVVRANGGHQR